MARRGIKITGVMAFCLVPTFGAVAQTAPIASTAPDIATWVKVDKTDPLRGNQFSQFSLEGKYLTAPRNAAANATPEIIVRCQQGSFSRGHLHRKFLEGYIFVGSVVDARVSDDLSVRVPVEYRLDDGKLQSTQWNHSTDYSSIFFGGECPLCGNGSVDFNNLLYGHLLPHKENTTPQVHKILIGVPEYLGSEVVMQFDMPDATDVAETCGVIWHK
jgi:hypothetical protein